MPCKKRIGRKTVSQKLQNDIPIVIMLYDLLEWEGRDIRHWPLHKRQALLAGLFHHHQGDGIPLLLSETMQFSHWDDVRAEREKATEKQSEGLMLKKRESTYGVGRKKELGGNGNLTLKPSMPF